jgi:hypothetical protein
MAFFAIYLFPADRPCMIAALRLVPTHWDVDIPQLLLQRNRLQLPLTSDFTLKLGKSDKENSLPSSDLATARRHANKGSHISAPVHFLWSPS